MIRMKAHNRREVLQCRRSYFNKFLLTTISRMQISFVSIYEEDGIYSHSESSWSNSFALQCDSAYDRNDNFQDRRDLLRLMLKRAQKEKNAAASSLQAFECHKSDVPLVSSVKLRSS